MTVDSSTNRIDYAPDGVVTVFPYDFRVDSANDLVVYADGELVEDGYTVGGVGDSGGGDVTFDDAPANTIEMLTLIREIGLTQISAYPALGPFPAASHEAALDRLTFITQQLQEQINRAGVAPIDSDESTNFTLPKYEAGGLWLWDVTEQKLVTSVAFSNYGVRKATDAEVIAGSETAVDAFVDSYQLKKYVGTTVGTIADLRSISYTPFDGQIIRLLGRVTTNDGGEGSFVWDSSDLSIPMLNDPGSGIYVAPASDLTGRSGAFVRQDKETLDPRQFATYEGARLYAKGESDDEAVSKPMVGHILIGTRALPFGESKRDAFQVSRILDGETDCHAFADKTLISNATDVGTYGAFDSQIEVGGTHYQQHCYSFQDRAIFSGTGTLATWSNLIFPTASGGGTVTKRTDLRIYDVQRFNGSIINEHVGIDIAILTADVVDPIAINIAQTLGHALYCAGGAKSYHKGELKIGANTATPGEIAFLVSGENVTDNQAYIDTSATSVSFGTISDVPVNFVNDAGVKLILHDSAGLYGFTPFEDDEQPLGSAAKRWSVVYSGTATINTSDEREKLFLDVEESEILVAKELKNLMRKFKFNNSIREKGFDNARIHWGIGAQTVKATFEKHGLVAEDYGMLCYDEWEDDEVNKVKAGNRYGIRYEELLCFIISVL